MNPTTAKVAASFKTPGTLYALSLLPDAKRMVTGGSDRIVRLLQWDSDKLNQIASWPGHHNYVSSMCFVRGRACGDMVVSGSYDKTLTWWDSMSGRIVYRIDAHAGWIRDVTCFPDGERLISVGDDMVGKIWDAKTSKLLATLRGHATSTPQQHVTALYAVAVSQDGQLVATGDRIGDVRIWNAGTGKLLHQMSTPELYTYDPRQRKRSIGGIRSLAFSPDGNSLAVGGMGQVGNVDGMAGEVRVELCDWKAGKITQKLTGDGHKGMINQLAFTPDGSLLIGAGGGGDNAILAFWKSDQEKPIHKIKHDGHNHRLNLSLRGDMFCVAGYGKVQVWTTQASPHKTP